MVQKIAPGTKISHLKQKTYGSIQRYTVFPVIIPAAEIAPHFPSTVVQEFDLHPHVYIHTYKSPLHSMVRRFLTVST